LATNRILPLLTQAEHREGPRLENQFIILTGIPGSGKTVYGEYLRSTHGFFFIETDKDERFILDAISPRHLGLVDSYLKQYPLVAVEWGFFPQLLECVLRLKNQGARLLWFFTAEEATARWAYCVKWEGNPHKLRLWEDQMQRIKNADLPTPDFQKIETFRDGSFRPYDGLDEECFRGLVTWK